MFSLSFPPLVGFSSKSRRQFLFKFSSIFSLFSGICLPKLLFLDSIQKSSSGCSGFSIFTVTWPKSTLTKTFCLFSVPSMSCSLLNNTLSFINTLLQLHYLISHYYWDEAFLILYRIVNRYGPWENDFVISGRALIYSCHTTFILCLFFLLNQWVNLFSCHL